MVVVQNKRRKIENIKKDYPNSIIVDVTSKGIMPMVKFSPFYPLGNIPIPFSKGRVSKSVEGIWQGLKVFENNGIDETKFEVDNMKGLKRTVRKYGKPLGHRKGLDNSGLLNYLTARKLIYLPTYKWVLDNYLNIEIQELVDISRAGILVLLDYETNGDVENLSKPLSHAQLVKLRVEDKF